MRRDGGLARADISLEQPEHRLGASKIGSDRSHRRNLVGRQADRPAELHPDRRFDRSSIGLVARICDDHRLGGRPAALPSPADHPQLECQQLIEGEPAEGCIAVLQAGRVVDLVNRPADRLEPFGLNQIGGQVLAVHQAGSVEGCPDGLSDSRRGQTRGQSIDRHDPARVERFGAVLGRELGVVEEGAEATLLQPAAHDEVLSCVDPPLDEASAEPGRLGLPGLIDQDGLRYLDPPSPGLLHVDRADHDAGACRRPVGQVAQLGNRAHLTAILIAPGQVEQEITDRAQVQPPAGPAAGDLPRQPALTQRRRQQFDRIGRRRCPPGRSSSIGRRRSAPRLPVHHSYSAEIKYR